jgi:hypothetical protein
LKRWFSCRKRVDYSFGGSKEELYWYIKKFGAASSKVVIEEFLDGIELVVSFLPW